MKQKTGKKSHKARLFALVNLAFFGFLLVAFGREHVGNIQIDQEIKYLEAEKARLEDERLATLNLIEDLSSEEYLEREARTKHGLAKPGETLIVIQGDGPVGAIDPSLLQEEIPDVSNTRRWFMYFFDREGFHRLQKS